MHNVKRQLYLAPKFNLVHIEVSLRETNEQCSLSGVNMLMIVAVSSVASNYGFISIFCLQDPVDKIQVPVFAKILNP